MEIAKTYHKAWNRLSLFVTKLHARNAFQILGYDLVTPVNYVICWTPDGCINHESRTIVTGGTGTAISIASASNIPIFNLARKDHLDRVKNGLLKL